MRVTSPIRHRPLKNQVLTGRERDCRGGELIGPPTLSGTEVNFGVARFVENALKTVIQVRVLRVLSALFWFDQSSICFFEGLVYCFSGA